MDLGFIDPALYASADYFDYYQESVLGLAPFLTTDESLLDRQFLYNFVKSNPLEKFEESFAFIGGGAVLIGGTYEDYEQMRCYNQFNDTVAGFNDKSLTIPDAIIEGNNSMSFSPPLYYSDEDIMLKI